MSRLRSRRKNVANVRHVLGFELLEKRLALSLTGDAPNPPYPTAQHGGPNGASFLGASQDVDNGVEFGLVRVGQQNAEVTIIVGGSGSGRLDAWIDFNRDGSWGGPGEQIANSRNFGVNTHTFTFDVPSWAEPGTTYARFRIKSSSTAIGFADFGSPAVNGEVEDHPLEILPSRPATGAFGAQNVIHDGTGTALDVLPIFAADIDDDGDNDVVSASSSDNTVAWYQNNNGVFTRISIGAANDPRTVFAADVDGDGDTDVLSASFTDSALYWYVNDGSPTGANWTRNPIPETTSGPRSIVAGDVDRDGDTDVVAASTSNDKITWYENNGSQTFTERLVNVADPDTNPTNATNGDVDGPTTVYAADIDRDGHLDIVTSSSLTSQIAWFENDGNPRDGGWTRRVIKNSDASPVGQEELSLVVVDINGDGDVDVVTANFSEDRIAWYENDGTPGNGTWGAARNISTAEDVAFAVFAADLDADGDMDVLSASAVDNVIAWFANNGVGSFSSPQVISTAVVGATSVFAADLDADDDLDVLSGSRGDNKVAWYVNPNDPGFMVTSAHSPLEVTEGGATDTFQVALLTKPTANVVIDVSVGLPTQATVNPTRLTFTTANWRDAKLVTVSAVNDSAVDGLKVTTISIVVNQGLTTDNSFDALGAQTLPLNIIDNDVLDFFATPSGGTTQVNEDGTLTDTFTVVLSHQPQLASNVVLDITSSDPGEVTISTPSAPHRLTFTALNWNQLQTVTVRGVNDSDLDGPVVTGVLVSINQSLTTDNSFDNIASKTVNVTNLDNEVIPPGDYDHNLTVNPADYSLWRANFNSTTQTAADGNQNGRVDAADYVVWRNNLGASGIHGSGAIVDVDAPTVVIVAPIEKSSIVAMAIVVSVDEPPVQDVPKPVTDSLPIPVERRSSSINVASHELRRLDRDLRWNAPRQHDFLAIELTAGRRGAAAPLSVHDGLPKFDNPLDETIENWSRGLHERPTVNLQSVLAAIWDDWQP